MSNLKDLREKKGLSQSQLAELSGVNLQTIQHYEQGVRSINKTKVYTALKLSKALECDIEELIEVEKL